MKGVAAVFVTLVAILSLASVIYEAPHAYPVDLAKAPLPKATIKIEGFGNAYCVSFREGKDLEHSKQVGQPLLVPFAPTVETYDTFIVGTRNALARIAQSAGRPDLVDLSVNIKWLAPGSAFPERSVGCFCSNTIWSGDPRSGGKVKGCGGPCGSCSVCGTTPQIEGSGPVDGPAPPPGVRPSMDPPSNGRN